MSMTIGTTMRVARPLLLSAVLSLLAPAIGQADVPGYELMFPERMALVVSPRMVQTTGKMPRAIISEQAARELTAGAEPVSGTSIVLLYRGKIYIVPDKRMHSGKMASEMVKSAAEHGR
jgi:hypothetical protein